MNITLLQIKIKKTSYLIQDLSFVSPLFFPSIYKHPYLFIYTCKLFRHPLFKHNFFCSITFIFFCFFFPPSPFFFWLLTYSVVINLSLKLLLTHITYILT